MIVNVQMQLKCTLTPAITDRDVSTVRTTAGDNHVQLDRDTNSSHRSTQSQPEAAEPAAVQRLRLRFLILVLLCNSKNIVSNFQWDRLIVLL